MKKLPDQKSLFVSQHPSGISSSQAGPFFPSNPAVCLRLTNPQNPQVTQIASHLDGKATSAYERSPNHPRSSPDISPIPTRNFHPTSDRGHVAESTPLIATVLSSHWPSILQLLDTLAGLHRSGETIKRFNWLSRRIILTTAWASRANNEVCKVGTRPTANKSKAANHLLESSRMIWYRNGGPNTSTTRQVQSQFP